LLRVLYPNGDLWLWREETGAAEPLTGGNVAAYRPSRDGAVIAFSRALANDQYELWAINSDGSQARRLATMSAAETWARNPQAVAINFRFLWAGDTHFLIYDFSPTLTGDGDFIERPPEPSFLVNADTGAALPVSPAPTYFRYDLSPNGEQVLAMTIDPRELHLINVADGRIQLVLPPMSWTFSPGGRYMVVRAEDGTVIVDTADLSQRRLAIPYRNFLYDYGMVSPPDFWVDESTWYTALPDSNDVAQSGATFTLWRSNVAEGTATAINTFSGYAHSMLFSSDRRYLIVPDVDEVVLVDTADLSQRRLPIPYRGIQTQGVAPADFWADETTWYLMLPDSDAGDSFTLWRSNVAEGTATAINTFSGYVDSVRVSPDRRFLAFTEATGDGFSNLHLADATTGQDVVYESGRFGLTSPRWQDDSTHFVYHYYSADSYTQQHVQMGHICRPPVPLISGDLRWVDGTRFLILKDVSFSDGSQQGTWYLQSLEGESALIGEFLSRSPFTGDSQSVHIYFEEPSGSCRNDSAFVLDVSIPDGAHIAPGASFTKTWRIRNSGTCTWDASYWLNFTSGERMDGPQSMALGETVPPGGEVDLSIDLIAPQADGTYQGQWQLVAPDGIPFGAKPYVEIVVP
jgi:Tol biopolymer transport system component